MESKKYILQYTSPGPASGNDRFLCDMPMLRRMIIRNVERKRAGEPYSDVLTGSTDDEKFCDSEDIEEVIADVIGKRMRNRTTLCSKFADLLELPEGIPFGEKETRLRDVIFSGLDEFFDEKDLICGSMRFIQHFMDMRDVSESVFDFENGLVHEFTSFFAKRCLLLFSHDTVDEEIETAKRTAETCPDIPSCRERFDFLRRKFAEPVACEDDYLAHLYEDRSTEWVNRLRESDELHKKGCDYRKLLYIAPPVGDDPGCYSTAVDDAQDFFGYADLFKEGIDIEHETATWTDSAKDMIKFRKPYAFRSLENVFF